MDPFWSPYQGRCSCQDCLPLISAAPAGSVDAIITDPPYGVKYASNRRRVRGTVIAGDIQPTLGWLRIAYRILTVPGVLLLFTRWDVWDQWFQAALWSGFDVRNMIVWAKNRHTAGDLKRSAGHQHELIMLATKGDWKGPWADDPPADRRPTDLIVQPRGSALRPLHPNEKPLGLMRRLILVYTRKSDLILDPFAGSGSTLVAAAEMGRRLVGFEISEHYCRRASIRLNQTGLL